VLWWTRPGPLGDSARAFRGRDGVCPYVNRRPDCVSWGQGRAAVTCDRPCLHWVIDIHIFLGLETTRGPLKASSCKCHQTFPQCSTPGPTVRSLVTLFSLFFIQGYFPSQWPSLAVHQLL
jgi:hypothetical protein